MDTLAKALLLALGITTMGGCAASGEEVAAEGSAISPAPPQAGDPANHATFGVDVSVWETALSQSEMDCFWASGARHVIVGTQDEGIARQQLAMAVSRGMTIDAYVYLDWGADLTAQVETAFERVAGSPVGRMWLDIEQIPGKLGSAAIEADIRQALTTCQAHGGPSCGIYTGPGFWKSYAGNTTAFSGVPLWWAEYDGVTSLASWSGEQFGGWTKPLGKQWASKPLCGIGGVDWDTIQVTATPTVVVDRTLPPDTGAVPPAPGGLFPEDGYVDAFAYAKIMSDTIPRATSYQLAIERWSGTAWLPYFTYQNPDAFVEWTPAVPNAVYHFRVRAENAHGWGAWSAWSSFDFGRYTGPRPGASAPDAGSPPPPKADSGPPAPQPASGVPATISPTGAERVTTPNVTLESSGVTGATAYQFAIEYEGPSGYLPYYTYSTGAASVTFYPATHGISYRWQVRAEVGGAFGAWSPYATFDFP